VIEQWLSQYAAEAPYLVIFGILLLTGFGLPLPEDIPLLIGGYLCGQTPNQAPHLAVMLPGCMVAILASDSIIYLAGRRFGPTIRQHRIMKRIVGPRNLARTRIMFKKRGGKFIFIARFLPGVRMPAFFTAGTFKMPFAKFILWNGSAALLSVPWVVLLAYIFHNELEVVRQAIAKGRTWGIIVVVGFAILLLGYHVFVGKRFARKAQLEAGADLDVS